MRISALLFDLDGTLLNTIDDLADSANYVLDKLGFPLHTTQQYKYFVGNGIPKLIERCLPHDKQEYKEQALKMFIEHYALHSEDKTAPYDGIKPMLERACEMGFKLGVITNKQHKIAKEVIAHYFPEIRFDYVRGLDDSIKAKPDPAGALEAAEMMGVAPENVLYIGDSSVDMQTAENAGFTSCGVLWGFRTREELCESGADFIVSAPDEILKTAGEI